MPANYCITVDQKYDFQVFNFHKYLPYSDTNQVSLAIYTGHHPSYFYGEYGFDEKSAKRVTSKFLDKNVEWLSFYDPVGKLYLKEQQISGNDIEKGLIVHIAMFSTNPILLDELTKIVGSVKLK